MYLHAPSTRRKAVDLYFSYKPVSSAAFAAAVLTNHSMSSLESLNPLICAISSGLRTQIPLVYHLDHQYNV